MIHGPLSAEIRNPDSPVRQFLDEHFTLGLRAVQRRYRQNVPPLTLAAAPGGANPGTVGTAAHWLLRFLLNAQPDLSLPVIGAANCALAKVDAIPALAHLAHSLEVPLPEPDGPVRIFTGPTPGNHAQPTFLARACWAFALLTEVYRIGPFAVNNGPLDRFVGTTPTMRDLLQLASPQALEQLAGLREIFERTLIPRLAHRTGPWALGPTFTGSQLIKTDADVIAAGLLLDLKTSAKAPSLAATDLFQIIGYALLDFDDAYRLGSLGLFTARYSHLVTWDLTTLLTELSGTPADIPALRQEFRTLLLAHRQW